MGLDDFIQNNNSKYKRYGSHEYDDKLEQWMEEMEKRFPISLDIEFVEVSPSMTKHNAMAYFRDYNTYYIRMSELYVESNTDRAIKLTLLHEMVHVYFYKKGYNDTNHDKYFRWVAGRVMSSMTYSTINDQKWKDCIEPFFEMDNSWD